MSESQTDDPIHRALTRRAAESGGKITMGVDELTDVIYDAIDHMDDAPPEPAPDPRRGLPPGSMAAPPGADPREGYEARRAEIQQKHDAMMARYNLPASIAPALRPERTGRI